MTQSSIQYEYSNYSNGSSAYYNMHSSSLYIQAEILLYIHTYMGSYRSPPRIGLCMEPGIMTFQCACDTVKHFPNPITMVSSVYKAFLE